MFAKLNRAFMAKNVVIGDLIDDIKVIIKINFREKQWMLMQ